MRILPLGPHAQGGARAVRTPSARSPKSERTATAVGVEAAADVVVGTAVVGMAVVGMAVVGMAIGRMTASSRPRVAPKVEREMAVAVVVVAAGVAAVAVRSPRTDLIAGILESEGTGGCT